MRRRAAHLRLVQKTAGHRALEATSTVCRGGHWAQEWGNCGDSGGDQPENHALRCVEPSTACVLNASRGSALPTPGTQTPCPSQRLRDSPHPRQACPQTHGVPSSRWRVETIVWQHRNIGASQAAQPPCHSKIQLTPICPGSIPGRLVSPSRTLSCTTTAHPLHNHCTTAGPGASWMGLHERTEHS